MDSQITTIDRRVLEYVRSHPASFQLNGCARETGLSIPQTLEQLNAMLNRSWLSSNGRVYALTPVGQGAIDEQLAR